MTERKKFYAILRHKVCVYKIEKETKKLFFVKGDPYGCMTFYKKEDGSPNIPWQYHANFIGFDLSKEQILEIVKEHINAVNKSMHASVDRIFTQENEAKKNEN